MTLSDHSHLIQLREVRFKTLPIFYEQQLDAEANWMAAFTSKDPTDRGAFDAHWMKILVDKGITIRTIVFEAKVAGSVLCTAGEANRDKLLAWQGMLGEGDCHAGVSAIPTSGHYPTTDSPGGEGQRCLRPGA